MRDRGAHGCTRYGAEPQPATPLPHLHHTDPQADHRAALVGGRGAYLPGTFTVPSPHLCHTLATPSPHRSPDGLPRGACGRP
eukprot:289571-Chlamydomonas_euryale.AAC.1